MRQVIITTAALLLGGIALPAIAQTDDSSAGGSTSQTDLASQVDQTSQTDQAASGSGSGEGESSQPPTAADQPDSLKIYFPTGSAQLGPDATDALNTAARLFRDASPFVMIVAGGADTVGSPTYNLDLSLERARTVANGLEARGIPTGRLQILGRGNSDLLVPTDDEVARRENRVVEITWR